MVKSLQATTAKKTCQISAQNPIYYDDFYKQVKYRGWK